MIPFKDDNSINLISQKKTGIGTLLQSPILLKNLKFQAKTEFEVIKVPKCNYANDVKGSSTYFLCQCSNEDFHTICEGCAKKCHNHHGPSLKLEGVYTCFCGKKNHIISAENEKTFEYKKLNSNNQCFFTKFMEITPNRGMFRYQNTKICSICLDCCYGLKPNHHDIEPLLEDNNYICKCNKHYELNVINLNVDLMSKPKFHFHLQNFNFNIISKNPISKQLYLDYLIKEIKNYILKDTDENNRTFFCNFVNFKILELFSFFAQRWENKFFHVKNYLQEYKPSQIMDLLKIKERNKIDSEKAADFVNCKFYYAEYLFNYFVRTYLLKYNNLWNIRTILNMNLYQRIIYIHNIKEFRKFDYYKENKNNQEFTNIQTLSETILQVYEEILKINENSDSEETILTYVFPNFNRIFKYLIKYNIVDDTLKNKYFDLVLETINLVNDGGYEHYYGSELYIIKSILYCLIYRNDHACMKILKEGEIKGEFVFHSTKENRNLSKVFIYVVNKYERKEDVSKTIIYDYYVRKILELMIGKSDFYIKNLENLTLLDDYKLEILLNPDGIHKSLEKKIKNNYMSEIVSFCNKLNITNRQYFDYDLNYEKYLENVNEIFKDFKNFINEDVNFLPDLTQRYQVFFDKNDNLNDLIIKRISDLQIIIPFTQFFQKVEEFLHILSEGKRYKMKTSFIVSGIHNEYLRILLHFLFLLVHKNSENMTLLMNIKPTVFVSAFIYVKEDLFNFLDLVSESLFSNNPYKFDNYYFFTESINAILNTFEVTKNLQKNIKPLAMLGRIMNITIKSIKFISKNQPDALNCVERIIDKLKIIKSDEDIRTLLLDFILNGHSKKYENLSLDDLNDLEYFLTKYFSYINELKFNDIYFLGLIKESDFLFEMTYLTDVIKKYLNQREENPNNLKIDINLEYNVIRFYLQMSICFNFKIYDGKKYLTNLLMKDIPENIQTYSLKFLSRNPEILETSDSEKIENNCNLILNIFNNIPTYFNKFADHKSLNNLEKKINLLLLYEHLILRPMYRLLNIYLDDTVLIKGKESFFIFKMVVYFVSYTVFFYQNIQRLFTFEKNSKKNSNQNSDMKKKENINNNLFEESRVLNMKEILDYENICIKGEIDLTNIEGLRDDFNQFLKEEIKYFHLTNVYQKFISVCKRIVNFKNPNFQDEEKRIERFTKVFTHPNSVEINQKRSKARKRVEDLIEYYKDVNDNTYDDKLAMINVLDTMENKKEIDIASELLFYLTKKLSDVLTENNLTQFGNSQKEELDLSNLVSKEQSFNNSNIGSKNVEKSIMNILVNKTKGALYNLKNNDAVSKLNETNVLIKNGNNKINLTKNLIRNNLNNESVITNNNANFKSGDKISVNSKNKKPDYKPSDLENISILNFKFQNTYCLEFLNLLFFHDSERFQGILEESYKNEYEHFFNFINCDLIFPCILREVDNSFDLNKHISNEESLPKDIAEASIKFLQNLCENHNQTYQGKFFNYDFTKTINIVKYNYIDSPVEENNEDNEDDEIQHSKKFLTIYKNFLNKEVGKKKKVLQEQIIENSVLSIGEHEIKDNFEENQAQSEANLNKKLIIKEDNNPILQINTESNKKFLNDNKNDFGKMGGENDKTKNQNPSKNNLGKNINDVQRKETFTNHNLVSKQNKLNELMLKREKLKERSELKNLKTKRVSFFNYIQHCERIIIQNLNLVSDSLSYKNKEFKNYDPLIFIHQRLNDLVIEMIQGTEFKNFDNFFKKLPENIDIFSKTKHLNNIPMIDNFIYIKKAFEIQYLLFEQNPFDDIGVKIKYRFFQLVTNVINQELQDCSIVYALIQIFPAEKLLNLSSKYIIALYVRYIENENITENEFDYHDNDFTDRLDQIELDDSCYKSLIQYFENNIDINENPYFMLVSQIFLFLTIIGEKNGHQDALKILQYRKRDLIKNESTHPELKSPPFYKRMYTWIKETISNIISWNQGYNQLNEENNVAKTMKINQTNNYIITAKFLSEIIYSCDFMIDSPNDPGYELIPKKSYFIIDPRAYMISQNNIDNFFETVDRSSRTSKLKSLIDVLSIFKTEVTYKDQFLKDHKSKLFRMLLGIEYKDVDFINFCMSLIINVIFLIFLEGGPEKTDKLVDYLIFVLSLTTILINCIYLIFFLLSKYNYYIILEKSKLNSTEDIENEEESHNNNYQYVGCLNKVRNCGENFINKFRKSFKYFSDMISIYLINSLLANEEIYLLILNIIICTIGMFSKEYSFLFSLQLLTVVKFVPTIKEIVIAFKLRFFQLFSMIAFLGILIFFYSIMGFYFLIDEFEMDLENGKRGNICDNLLECWITYFNLGVRSGGGIGDLLGPKPFSLNKGIYWIRFFTDMIFFITVILLLLNMINGVIVSTFSQIREESNNKEEDIKNKCFICNIDRSELEKRKQEFELHLEHEHNSITYIKYFICLGFIHEKDLDADQSFILNCINNRDVYCFPVAEASDGEEQENEETKGENIEEDEDQEEDDQDDD